MASAVDWIQVIFLGGLSGALGQAARTIVGIKKVNDLAAAESTDPKDLIVASRLFISLTIGFVAGALAALAMDLSINAIEVAQILGFAAAGYAGADFIEGFISKTPLPEPPGGANKRDTPPPEGKAPNPGAESPAKDDYQG